MNLQSIDRRIVYILLVIAVWIPLRWNVIGIDPKVSKEVKSAYDTIENVEDGKIAIISVLWGAGTLAENRPQTEAIARHLFQKGVPFAILPWDLQGTTLAEQAVERIAEEMGKKEGVDWISLGYRPAYIDQIIMSMAVDFQGTFSTDRNGIPLSKIPMTKNIKSVKDIGVVMETTPSNTIPAWIQFLGQKYDVPILYGPTAVMVPEGYNYLDTGQIKGMLPGMMGAAQYEVLLEHRGFGRRAADALSAAHLLIILLIIVGNIGFFMARTRRADM